MQPIAIVVFAALCALATGHAVPTKSKVADMEFLTNQAKLFELMQNIHQHDGVLMHLHEQADKFVFAEHYEHFTDMEAIKAFEHMYIKKSLLGMNEIFSYHNERHLKQSIALFRMFYYASDFKMFYKVAQWARFHTNPGMFVYALTMTMLHRTDLAGYELPAPYEIFPQYYFSSEAIQTAQNMKMMGFQNVKKIEGMYQPLVMSNYTYVNYGMNEEQKLAYFTEDIGLNAFYYYLHMDYPFWMDGEKFGLAKDRRGEFYLYMHQQMLARFYMERLSNDMGDIPEFSFFDPIETGYNPALRFYNGQHMTMRQNDYMLNHPENYHSIDMLVDFERRIRDAIAMGYITLPDGKRFDLTKPESINELGNLIQGNVDSLNKRFYNHFFLLAKVMLGGATFEHRHHYAPAALEQFETTVRDPMFWQLFKRVIRWYWQFKNELPSYERKDIEFSGVHIENVDVDKLETFFDMHDADMTNAVYMEPLNADMLKSASDFQKFGKISHHNGDELMFKVRQQRLNHGVFSYRLHVMAEKAVTGVVRVFMAPKFDEFGHKIELTENRENFLMMDAYKVDLMAGKNVIERSSDEYTWYVKDRTTFYDLYKWVMTATKGETKFTLDMGEAHNGMPNRLMLPKGKKAGMPFQFFFIVSPFHAPAVEQFSGFDPVISSGVGSGARFIDSLPFGYPFDREIELEAWYTPNMIFKDVNIFHKKESDINSVHAMKHE